MKSSLNRIGNIVTIITASGFLVLFLVSNNGDLTSNFAYSGLLAGLLFAVIGAIGSLAKQKWGKYVTIGGLAVTLLLSLSNPFGLVLVILSAVLIGLTLFT